MKYDLTCPVACGFCCRDSWQSVTVLRERFPFEALCARESLIDAACPFLKKAGCVLPREERPETCRAFICDLGYAVLSKKVTLKWARKQLSKNENNPIYVWNDYNHGKFQTRLTKSARRELKKRNKNENRYTS
jgi:hypothetical protein